MADIAFDTPPGQINAICDNLLIQGHDVMVDSAARRKAQGGFRRALVHDQNDGLTLNFNGDYPGGVTINGDVRIILHHLRNPVTGQRPPDEVLKLQDVIATLRSQIAELQAEVAALKK